jgi:hypothetical protein
LQGFLLQVEVSVIILHEAEGPNAIVDLLDAWRSVLSSPTKTSKRSCGCRLLKHGEPVAFLFLLRMAWLDAFDGDAEPKPPDSFDIRNLAHMKHFTTCNH